MSRIITQTELTTRFNQLIKTVVETKGDTMGFGAFMPIIERWIKATSPQIIAGLETKEQRENALPLVEAIAYVLGYKVTFMEEEPEETIDDFTEALDQVEC